MEGRETPGLEQPESQEDKINRYLNDIQEQSENNPGAVRVLAELLTEKGFDVFDSVAPNLGKGSEVYDHFKRECDEDIDILVEKFGEKEDE